MGYLCLGVGEALKRRDAEAEELHDMLERVQVGKDAISDYLLSLTTTSPSPPPAPPRHLLSLLPCTPALLPYTSLSPLLPF